MGGRGFDFAHPGQVMEEIASLVPIYKGISYERLENGGLQWPCVSREDPGTPFLHTQAFATKNGKGKFIPLEYKPSAETPDDEYPLLLTTESSLYHYTTATMTRRVAGLNMLKAHALLDINPKDATQLGIANGEMVQVFSRRGNMKVNAQVTNICPPGIVCMNIHFAEAPTNFLTNAVFDPAAKTPETKVCAVRIEKLNG